MNQTARESTIATSSATDAAAAASAGVRRRRLGRVVAAALVTGLVTGVLLVFVPVIPASEAGATGALLCGFALGWALLAVQSQRWAAVPAAVMGLGGVILIMFGSSAQQVLSWVWPPALLAVTVWMVVQGRRQAFGAGARVLLYPVFAFLAVASIGGGIETVLETVDAARYPMAGQLVDVDGHGMHLSCTGTGAPTVVLEPGAGELSANLGWVTPAVSRDTRVCVYDRPGRGWSDPTDTPQDGTRVAADLHTLLHVAHVPGPYVLAGHSFGGLYVLAYAAHYPQDVAGMVLIDSTAPTTPGPRVRASAGTSDGLVARGSALVSIAARLGLGRLYSATAYGGLPARSRDEVRATVSTATTLRSTIDEFAQASISMRQAAELRAFGAKPLVVLTAGDGSDAAWFAEQDRLARLSTNTSHRVVAGASHEMLVGDRTASASTIAAIRDVVASVRSGASLTR